MIVSRDDPFDCNQDKSPHRSIRCSACSRSEPVEGSAYRVDERTSVCTICLLHEIAPTSRQARLRLFRTRGWWLLIVSAFVAHATEALRPGSAQEPRFTIQYTSVSLGLEQIDDLESQSLLIIRRRRALKEDIMVGLVIPELRPRDE